MPAHQGLKLRDRRGDTGAPEIGGDAAFVVRLSIPGTGTPVQGTVEDVTLRVTQLRTVNGEVVIGRMIWARIADALRTEGIIVAPSLNTDEPSGHS